MIGVEHISKTYRPKDASTRAVEDVTFEVPRGAFFTLLGPSGCGKTTTMRCIAGLERPDLGVISIADRVVFDGGNTSSFTPTAKRPIGMVFQSYTVWPHMTVFENVAYPLRVKRLARSETRKRVMDTLELVGLAGLHRRRAPQLSGGQQQRVALARAIVARPDVLLLDEPLSNLDAAMRVQMRAELKGLQSSLDITTVYVTHDQHEALAMSDAVAVMSAGRLVHIGTPLEVYHHPRTRFVAEFVGATNLLAATSEQQLSRGVNIVRTDLGDISATLPNSVDCRLSRFTVSIRPEAIDLADDSSEQSLTVLSGVVTGLQFIGEAIEYTVAVGNNVFRVRRPSIEPIREAGSRVALSLSPDSSIIVPPDSVNQLEEPEQPSRPDAP